MRCRMAAILVMIGLLFASCTSKAADPITSGFVCNADVVCDGVSYSGTLEVREDTGATLTMTHPATVAGLTFSMSEDTLRISFAGMDLALSDSQIPAGAAIQLLCKALDRAAERTENAQGGAVQGEINGVPYTLRFDEQSGMPLELMVPSVSLSVTCSGWQRIV